MLQKKCLERILDILLLTLLVKISVRILIFALFDGIHKSINQAMSLKNPSKQMFKFMFKENLEHMESVRAFKVEICGQNEKEEKVSWITTEESGRVLTLALLKKKKKKSLCDVSMLSGISGSRGYHMCRNDQLMCHGKELRAAWH